MATATSNNHHRRLPGQPLPVTVLSGFLGAGKTTLLSSLLRHASSTGLRLGLVVNDMADLAVDAALLKGAVVGEADERMVSLSNGCVCCTLREDLLVELTRLAAREREDGTPLLDAVVVESSGISEPLPVAETFAFQGSADNGPSLREVARLDGLVTVVDGSTFRRELGNADDLRARGWVEDSEEEAEADDRTVAQLLCDQVEFATILVLSKVDLLDEEERGRVRALLGRFNPTAKLLEGSWGRVDPAELLFTDSFQMGKAQEHPDWLKEARFGEHTPETEEYGISSITFRSRRPFHVGRFDELAAAMETRRGPSLEEAGVDARLPPSQRAAARSVLRSKGLVWLASQQGHWQQATASLAGQRFHTAFGSPWMAAIHRSAGAQHHELTEEKKEELGWDTDGPWGDRRTELVVIGQDLDRAAMHAALEACLVTDEEMGRYTELFEKAQPLDVLANLEAELGEGEVAERIRRYRAEVLVPKEKKTQILAEAPKATEAISAHSCLAVYQGTNGNKDGGGGDDTTARFRITRYLRYAHLLPDLASGLVQEFALPLASADLQTSLLVDETVGDLLSETIGRLREGDKVELEWLQIRVEYDTPVDEDRYRIIQQCQKLAALEEDAEKALLQQYPQPQIMIRKDQMNNASCVPSAAPAKSRGSNKGTAKGATKQGKNGKKKGKKGKRR